MGLAAFLIPIILAYTGYSYWLFRGKIRAGEGYHRRVDRAAADAL